MSTFVPGVGPGGEIGPIITPGNTGITPRTPEALGAPNVLPTSFPEESAINAPVPSGRSAFVPRGELVVQQKVSGIVCRFPEGCMGLDPAIINFTFFSKRRGRLILSDSSRRNFFIVRHIPNFETVIRIFHPGGAVFDFIYRQGFVRRFAPIRGPWIRPWRARWLGLPFIPPLVFGGILGRGFRRRPRFRRRRGRGGLLGGIFRGGIFDRGRRGGRGRGRRL